MMTFVFCIKYLFFYHIPGRERMYPKIFSRCIYSLWGLPSNFKLQLTFRSLEYTMCPKMIVSNLVWQF